VTGEPGGASGAAYHRYWADVERNLGFVSLMGRKRFGARAGAGVVLPFIPTVVVVAALTAAGAGVGAVYRRVRRAGR
jgi:hypothetical protein